MRKSNYDKFPFVEADGCCIDGWEKIVEVLKERVAGRKKAVVVVECYPGVYEAEVLSFFRELLPVLTLGAQMAYKEECHIREMVQPDVTDDRVFGYLSRLDMGDYLDQENLRCLQEQVAGVREGVVLICGTGASYVAAVPGTEALPKLPEDILLVYADLARWEIQLRMRRNEVDNLGVSNKEEPFSEQYKHAFFVDWRVADRLKKQLMHRWDYVLDTHVPLQPNLIEGQAVLRALEGCVNRPFRVVPFFDPGSWGGTGASPCLLQRWYCGWGCCLLPS